MELWLSSKADQLATIVQDVKGMLSRIIFEGKLADTEDFSLRKAGLEVQIL